MKKLIYLILAVACLSCVKDRPEGIGEQIVPAPEGFAVMSGGVSFSTSDEVDFDADSVYLQATFNSVVTANIEITGLSSGAKRTMLVLDNKLDHTNSTWFGEFDSGTTTFFRSGEEVEVSVSFYNSELIFKNTMKIGKALSYGKSANLILVDPRESGNNGFENTVSDPWWFDSNTARSHKGEAITQRRNDIAAPQGKYYMELTGKAPSGGTYIGGSSYGSFSDGPDLTKGKFYQLPSNPDSVWFNFYVYGESESITDLYVVFHESDAGTKSNGDPEDDAHVKGRDDGVQFLQKFNHEGWKLFSYKYSDLPFATYCIPPTDGSPGDGGGCGTKSYDSDRIKVVSFSLQSEQKELPVSAKVDYCMFTIGKPFDPVSFKR